MTTNDKTPTPPPSAEVFEQTLIDNDRRIHKQYRRDMIIAHGFTIFGGVMAGVGTVLLISGGSPINLITIAAAIFIIWSSFDQRKRAEKRFEYGHQRLDTAQRLYDLGLAIQKARESAKSREMREDGE